MSQKVKNHREDAKKYKIDFPFFATWRLSGERKKSTF